MTSYQQDVIILDLLYIILHILENVSFNICQLQITEI